MTRRIPRRRRGRSPASLPDDDDILREIFVRLPPTPSSLARASAVCRRWRGLLADPKFHRQLCARHRDPPLLGSFVPEDHGQRVVFAPMLDPPDRIPPRRFDLGRCGQNTDVLGCRHGRVLVKDRVPHAEVIVCDPITGDQRTVAYPPDFTRVSVNGAVLCAAAAADPGHVHGSCYSSPFKLVLVTMYRRHPNRLLACVYSSNTGLWGDLISLQSPSDIHGKPAVLVGNSLYWLSLINGSILEFDLDGNSIAVMMGPPVTHDDSFINHEIIKAEDGAVGYAMLVYPSLQMWKRDVDAHGDTTWAPWKTWACLMVRCGTVCLWFFIGYFFFQRMVVPERSSNRAANDEFQKQKELKHATWNSAIPSPTPPRSPLISPSAAAAPAPTHQIPSPTPPPPSSTSTNASTTAQRIRRGLAVASLLFRRRPRPLLAGPLHCCCRHGHTPQNPPPDGHAPESHLHHEMAPKDTHPLPRRSAPPTPRSAASSSSSICVR